MPTQVRQFTRAFRLWNRLFPGSQIGAPSEVSNQLALVAEMMRPSFSHDARLLSETETFVSVGADVNLDHPEPSAGFVHFPVCWAVTYTGAANIRAAGTIVATTSGLDPWGRWTAVNVGFSSVQVAANRYSHIPVFPYSRGNHLRTTFVGPVAAETVVSQLFYLECPGELCDLQHWLLRPGNFVNQVPLT